MNTERSEFITYKGENITFAEMPYGCEVWETGKDKDSIVIGSLKDARNLITSLEKMIETLSHDHEPL